jgi:hypothetical protein
MDKSQKQLVDTYFRKRIIAAPHGYDYKLKPYEKVYALKTGIVEFDALRKGFTGEDVAEIVADMPELRTKLTREDFGKMNVDDKMRVFVKSPELADDEIVQQMLYFVSKGKNLIFQSLTIGILIRQPRYADTRFFSEVVAPYLDGDSIMQVLMKQPALVQNKNFVKVLPHLSGDEVVAVIVKQPSTVGSFNLNKLNIGQQIEILVGQPQLADKLNLSKLKGSDIDDLIMMRPQLRTILNKLKRNG